MIEFKNVSKHFGPTQVLHNIDLSIKQGEVVVIIGPSGSGKSTLLRCINKLEEITSGDLIVDGLKVNDPKVDERLIRQEAGMVFQQFYLFPHLTALENVMFGPLRVRGASKAAAEAQAKDLLAKVGLAERAHHYPSELSGGQQQRVALARILVNEPDILLLDEPFSALDSYLKEKVMTELKNLLRQFPKDVVLVTHSRDEAYQLCQSIAVLDDGRVSACAPTKELFADPQSRVAAVLTGCKNIVAARKAGPTAVFIPSWQITLQTGRPVGDDLCAIGIRGHAFCGGDGENARPIVVTEEIEQPFEWIVKFRYAHQEGGTPDIWWRFAKPDRPAVLPDCLTVDGQAILLLYR